MSLYDDRQTAQCSFMSSPNTIFNKNRRLPCIAGKRRFAFEKDKPQYQEYFLLFHRDRFCQVPRFIDVAALAHGTEISHHLQRDDPQYGREQIFDIGDGE